MTYLSPLAYLLGLEGVALLRGMRDGTGDREFVETRISEIRDLLTDPTLSEAGGVDAVPGSISTDDVYAGWAESYDGPNSMIDLEQPLVREILAALPVGTALDAACGTGRHAAYLADLGHRAEGFDPTTDLHAVHALLTGARFDDVFDRLGDSVIAERDGGEQLILSIGAEVRGALVESTPDRLQRVAP